MKIWPFFELIRRESSLPLRKLTLTASAAGLSNAFVLSVVNSAAADLSEGGTTTRDFMIFIVVVVLYVISQASLMLTATHGVETMVHNIRKRISAKISACELATLEKVGRGALFGSVSRDTQIISQSALTTVIGIQFGILLIFTTIYIAILSMVAFFLVLGFTLVIGYFQVSRRKKLNEDLHTAAQAENKVFELVNHLLDGFKEVKMSQQRSLDLLHHVDEFSGNARDKKSESLSTIAKYFIFSQVSFYILLGIIVFIAPQLSDDFAQTITKIAASILFMMGPVQGIAGAIPQIETANTAAEDIERIEKLLDEAAVPTPDPPIVLEPFEKLALERIRYTYVDDDDQPLFSIGPVDLGLQAGEVVFISGGNGSGKSTMLNVLTSLYAPLDGVIALDSHPLTTPQRQAYRENISAVFSNFHLFEHLYGLGDISDDEANEKLDYLGLSGKTSVEDGRFETLHLSGGQRRRLALLIALLEDRPVMVFDEVAADQDPEFRRRFYREILPDLKAQGKIVLVITHDDAYYSTADRLFHMTEGLLVERPVPEEGASA